MMHRHGISQPKASTMQPPCHNHEQCLLEDWPQQEDSSQEADHPQMTKPKVSFSDKSTLLVYDNVDYLHQEKKAYNDEELYNFKVKAMIDVRRIQYLIVACQQDSVASSIKFLVENDIITRDELVGLDHLILGSSSSVMQVRHNHMSAVLCKQHEQQQQRFRLWPKLNNEEFDSVKELDGLLLSNWCQRGYLIDTRAWSFKEQVRQLYRND